MDAWSAISLFGLFYECMVARELCRVYGYIMSLDQLACIFFWLLIVFILINDTKFEQTMTQRKQSVFSFWLNRITWTVEARRTIVCKKISVCPSVLCSITRNVFPWRWLARYLTVHWNVFKQSGRCVQTFIYPDDLDSRYWHTASCTASHTRTWYLLSAKILCLCVSCVLCCCSGAYTESSWAFYILSTSACYSHIKISHQFHSTGRFKSPIPDDSC